MITLETLQSWLHTHYENEHLEFKEAKTQFDTDKLFRYCAAFANEGGGHLVLGVTDDIPHKIVGTSAFSTPNSVNNIKQRIVDKIHIRVNIIELPTPEGRVLVFEVPSRCSGQPISIDGAYWMRSGGSIVPMTQDMLRKIFAEGQPDWLSQSAKENTTPDEVIALLDTQKYFDLLETPYPTNRDAVLAKLENDGLISRTPKGWTILNLSALLLAKKLDAFSFVLSRKAPRVIIYDGNDKLKTKTDITGNRGYAVGFEDLLEFVYSAAPQNHIFEQTIRVETKMFPKQALY